VPGIHDLPLESTPIAVLDVETTGLSPKMLARVVEIAVVRINPDGGTHLVLDTLVDPGGPVHCSEIHGIYDEDVIGAPAFRDVMAPLAAAVKDCVVLSFNAAFDISFIESELAFAQRRSEPAYRLPYGCLMYMKPALGFGKRSSLHSALDECGLAVPDHRAAHDALAAAALWQNYRTRAIARGVRTFGDIAARKAYKFMTSWDRPRLTAEAVAALDLPEVGTAAKPRIAPPTYPDHTLLEALAQTHAGDPPARIKKRERALAVGAYAHALVDVFADGAVYDEEVNSLLELQRTLGVLPGEIRCVHAEFYASVLQACVEDGFVSHQESSNIEQMSAILRRLGWTPGDLSAPK
jgi:hypothetical protein